MQLLPILSCVIRRSLCPKIMLLKFMHIPTDGFRLVFAFYFTSCNNSRMYLECWSVAIQKFECLIVYKILDRIASRKTIRFLTLRQWRIQEGAFWGNCLPKPLWRPLEWRPFAINASYFGAHGNRNIYKNPLK